jgi:S1-C subfamily serine protease
MAQVLDRPTDELIVETDVPTEPPRRLPPDPLKRRRSWKMRGFLAVVLVAALSFAGGRFTAESLRDSNAGLVTANADTTAATSTGSLPDIISKAMPSIVSVKTVTTVGPFGQPAQAQGSGVVIRRDGIILTNAHVIENASQITVTTSDGNRSFQADLVGSDPEHDIAILQVPADDLTPITLGSSDQLRLGDKVVALGFPLGLGTTATQGIVSGLDRTVQVSDGPFDAKQLTGLLQTDAAINPGNSGGALLDSDGHLVGINTAAASASSAENVGFAVAIDRALPIINELLNNA